MEFPRNALSRHKKTGLGNSSGAVWVQFRASQTFKKNSETKKSQGQKAALSRHNTAHKLSSGLLYPTSRNLSSSQVLI